jgi:hypothetical protein
LNKLCEVLEIETAEGIGVPPWVSAPYQLVSWWEMQKFSGERLSMIFSLLGGLDGVGQNQQLIGYGESKTPDLSGFRDGPLTHIMQLAAELGLRSSYIYAQKTRNILAESPVLTHNEFRQTNKCLQEIITAEVSSVLLLHIDSSKVVFLQDKNQFGDEVVSRFPSAIVDMEEAARCYGLNRNTACVMHLQRVMEVGLKTLTLQSGITGLYNPSWDAMLEKLDQELKKDRKTRSSFVSQHLQQIAEATALLRSAKIAWRNPTMHVENFYDEEKALDVFSAVKGFMRSLASFVSEQEMG